MKRRKNDFLFSMCEEIMPKLPLRTRERMHDSFALMVNDGETLSPMQIAEISQRNKLFPVFITFSTGRSLDVSRLYARALGATLFMPRSSAASFKILTACNFSICEGLESAIISLCAGVPAYVNASSRKCRSFVAALTQGGISPCVLSPYTKNRTEHISKLFPCDDDFTPVITELRNILYSQ